MVKALADLKVAITRPFSSISSTAQQSGEEIYLYIICSYDMSPYVRLHKNPPAIMLLP